MVGVQGDLNSCVLHGVVGKTLDFHARVPGSNPDMALAKRRRRMRNLHQGNSRRIYNM
jgi:hypothetical protein